MSFWKISSLRSRFRNLSIFSAFSFSHVVSAWQISCLVSKLFKRTPRSYAKIGFSCGMTSGEVPMVVREVGEKGAFNAHCFCTGSYFLSKMIIWHGDVHHSELLSHWQCILPVSIYLLDFGTGFRCAKIYTADSKREPRHTHVLWEYCNIHSGKLTFCNGNPPFPIGHTFFTWWISQCYVSWSRSVQLNQKRQSVRVQYLPSGIKVVWDILSLGWVAAGGGGGDDCTGNNNNQKSFISTLKQNESPTCESKVKYQAWLINSNLI